MNYRRYLNSRYWINFKRDYFKHFPKTCIICGSTDKVQLHHKNYKHLYNEDYEDVICLCRFCHAKKHGKKELKKSKRRKIKHKHWSKLLKQAKKDGVATTPLH